MPEKERLASRLRAPALGWARAISGLALLSACGSGPDSEPADPGFDAGSALVDAGPPRDSSSSAESRPTQTTREDSAAQAPTTTTPIGAADAGTSASSASARDAGVRPSSADAASGTPSKNEIDSLIDALLGASNTAGSASDGGASGEWKLEPDSAPECPAEPPPIPIIGGPCLGIYYLCGWKNPAGEIYTCTCDWVHWLCI